MYCLPQTGNIVYIIILERDMLSLNITLAGSVASSCCSWLFPDEEEDDDEVEVGGGAY